MIRMHRMGLIDSLIEASEKRGAVVKRGLRTVMPSLRGDKNENEIESDYRQVPRLPVLMKTTLKTLVIITGNLTGTLRDVQVHIPPPNQTSPNTESEIVKVNPTTNFFYDDPTTPIRATSGTRLREREPMLSNNCYRHGYFYRRLHREIKNVYLES